MTQYNLLGVQIHEYMMYTRHREDPIYLARGYKFMNDMITKFEDQQRGLINLCGHVVMGL